jgi:hypothetical protein
VKRICKVCGEENHHEPEWLTIPDGCVCDWREWDWGKLDAIPPACAEYVGDGSDNCQRCEHDPDCHRRDKP